MPNPDRDRLADVARAGAPGVASSHPSGSTASSTPGHPPGHASGPVTPGYVALDVQIPSDVREIEPVVNLVTEHCKTLRLSKRQCSLNIPVALSEALSNAIISGNHEDPRKQVRLRATVSDHALVFDVVDEGRGFDMAVVSHDPTTPEYIAREDGRGIFLMHQLMDRVEQFRDPQHVVRLTLNR